MIYVTRHGQTEWNKINKVMGKVNLPLSEVGIKQAKQTKENLKDIDFDIIISSPLLRAKETTNIINEDRNVLVIYDNRISERDFGEMEGLTINDFNFEDFWDYYKNLKYVKAENIQDFFYRVHSAIIEYQEKYKDKNILLVTHGGVNIAINCFFKEKIPQGTVLKSVAPINNCEVIKY